MSTGILLSHTRMFFCVMLQVGFFDFVALPLVRAFAEAFPGGQPLVACFEENYRHWVQVQQQQNQQQ